MIKFIDVNKKFIANKKEIYALKNINLEISKGEIFGIIGYSGAGKSTLLRCINHLEVPSSGKVYVNHEEIGKKSKKELQGLRKRIGMIFQNFNLLNSRNVKDNIAFPLRKCGLTKEEIDKKIDYLLNLVDLEDKKFVYPSQLSGGQKQRVAIARALASDPEILLCDEVTSALDPNTTKQILKLLKHINKNLNITIVMITHEMEVVKEICERVAVMEDGRIVEMNTVRNLVTDPQLDITRKFLSSCDLFEDACVRLKNIYMQNQGFAKLVMLKYDQIMIREAIISKISVQYQIEASILYGNIEYIQDVPIGKLLLLLKGDSQAMNEAILFIKEFGVEVEVIENVS